jgi:phosphatidylglycerophosphatase A
MKPVQENETIPADPGVRTVAGRSVGQTPTVAEPALSSSKGKSRTRSPLWATLVATVFGVGYLRPGPGTWGSAVAVLLWTPVAAWLPPTLRTVVAITLALLVTLVAIPAATRVARDSASKDPQFVVVDEVAGQVVALIAVPLAWKTFLAGFILFRVFDIVKPPPVRQLERLPDGAGIVLDDVAAGIYALAAMQLLLHFGLLN